METTIVGAGIIQSRAPEVLPALCISLGQWHVRDVRPLHVWSDPPPDRSCMDPPHLPAGPVEDGCWGKAACPCITLGPVEMTTEDPCCPAMHGWRLLLMCTLLSAQTSDPYISVYKCERGLAQL